MTRKNWVFALAGLMVLVSCSDASDRPDVDPVELARWVEDRSAMALEFNTWFEGCMLEEGFEYSSQGINRIPNGQIDAWEAATLLCSERASELGLGGAESEKSEQDYVYFFAYQVSKYECLVEAGFAIPDPPTFETWMDTYWDFSDNANHWDPYRYVQHDDWGRALSACPQTLD